MKTKIVTGIFVIFILITVIINIIIIVAVVIIIMIVVVSFIFGKTKKSSVLFTYNPPSKKSPFIITGRRCCLANHPD